MKKSLLITGTLATVGIVGIVGFGTASAATDMPDPAKTSIVERLAIKFNLNKDEVQKVFEEERAARHAEREQAMKDYLTEAVKDGDLTQEQADKITGKHTEMHTFMEDMKVKTRAERRTAMEQKRDELEQWAKDNNIPEQYLKFGRGGPHGGRGFIGETSGTRNRDVKDAENTKTD